MYHQMKKIASVLTLLALLTNHFNYAQVTIEGTYLPVVNTRIQQVWDTSATLMAVPTTGPNQLWDYSMAFDPSLTSVNLDTFDLAVYAPSTTSYFSDFPDATHASFLRSPFGLADSLWLYFIVDTLGVHNMGYYSTSADAQGLITADPMEFVMPDELNYLDTIYDTSRYEGYINYMGFDAKIVRVNLKTMIADGYGTLVTPDATYGDVMLGKEVIYEIDSLWVDLTGAGIYSLIQADTTDWHRFHFLRNNTFASTHLMQINTNMAETDVKYGWYTLPVDFGSISGIVYDDTTGDPVTNGEMYLYREHSNHTKNDILSMTTINFDGSYTFDSIPYGEYRISARPNLGIYNHAFTTYYGDTTDWINCQTVITSGDTTGIDIHILYGPPQSTSVSIQGNVSYNSLLKNNDPIPGIDIIVEKDPEDNPISESTTDSFGNFTFPFLDDGDYTIWVDIPGLNMVGSYSITVAGGLVISNLDFQVGSDSIYPLNLINNIKPIQSHQGNVQVYPNPFSEVATVSINLKQRSKIVIEVIDVSGKIVSSIAENEIGIGRQTYSIDDLTSSGLYFIKISINEHMEVLRIIKN